ncbi:serine protease [Mycobacterium sp. Y57]|uniref:trypsin-like serine peptidase n=1 Tax=Mycolicibacterium xanthum TaxID=2796469 RepID=UPI001C85E6EB|nr:serine protease [Mycolicibacterium xanthum]MBX7432755.1 serine protease [Mycolicibacterium xanthum]
MRRCIPILLVVGLSACTHHPAGSPVEVAMAATPTAHRVAPDPRIGALFVGGGDVHFCSASVLDSETGDLILTAAHCVAGGEELGFVPGLSGDGDGERWQVDEIYLDPRWAQNQDPVADYAIARVSRDDGARVESVVGGGLRLGTQPQPGSEITVMGYAAGVGGDPASCRVVAAPRRQDFPAMHCDGIVDGFSGAPWISGSTVTGVIGGLDGGGCADEVSYTPPFDEAIAALLTRAESGGPGDDAPTVFDDGCRG